MQFVDGYWNNRYLKGETGWDLGQVSPPLKAYFDQLENKDLDILIPGAGNAYEAEFLYNGGFENVHVCDIAVVPLRNLQKRIPGFPADQIHRKDFFELQGQFDLIVEQTFFCAIDPQQREAYAKKARQLLRPGGRLVGLLFDIPLNSDQPPFGGDKREYMKTFEKDFEIHIMDTAYNSIPPRAGNELFVLMSPKK